MTKMTLKWPKMTKNGQKWPKLISIAGDHEFCHGGEWPDRDFIFERDVPYKTSLDRDFP